MPAVDEMPAADAKRRHVLVLGGTAHARRLADALAAAGWSVTYALAGLTARPKLPAHPRVRVRRGGFGGAEGLARWLRSRGVAALIDATHSFAATMPGRALSAARSAGVAHARFSPPPPPLPPDDGLIRRLHSIQQAADIVPKNARAFAALGSRGLAALKPRGDLWLSARMLAAPQFAVPPRWRLLRGPRAAPRPTLAQEAALLKGLRVEWLIARHAAGGARLLRAAALLGLEVALISPPPPPPGASLLRSVAEALAWSREHARSLTPRET